ncbi:MAG: beta-1,6-N-acetylglucosaminyltransferase [Amylibacter sp.]
MKLGFIILAHQDLHRTGQLVKFLAKNNCPVSLHIDQNASHEEVSKLKASLNHIENVVFSKRERCGWGQFSIVQATLNAAEVLLKNHPDVTNIFLASGSCLPARPIKQLMAFLERHKGTDFIESFPAGGEKWVKGGLDQERFTLYFPLSWRKHRFAFDRLVDVQRFLKINRTVPKHIVPHLGSQWWCLTKETLLKIVADPLRQQNDRFFLKTWISDESYFQSLARVHSNHIKAQSLTFAIFDSQGKPFLFYDDHLTELPKTGAFFIRKAWPGAHKLYRNLLTVNRKNFPLSKSNEQDFNKIFLEANEIRNTGGEGRFLQGRFPHNSAKRSGVSNVDFGVFVGPGFLFQGFPEWAHTVKGLNVFGNLFNRRHLRFRKKAVLAKGNLSANIKLRNTHPKGFLSNFLWGQKSDKRTAFLFDMTDAQKIMPSIVKDGRAHFVIVKEAWLISIANSPSKFKGKLMRTQVLQARENKFLKALENNKYANCTVFSLEEALNAPGLVLQAGIQILEPEVRTRPTALPRLCDTAKLDALVRKLEKNNVSLAYRADKKKRKALNGAEKVADRPYVVRS